MIESMTFQLIEFLRSYGAWGVFWGVIVESVIIPIPSPLIIMGAGSILIDPQLSSSAACLSIFWKITLSGGIASTIGAYFSYAIGYWGRESLVDRCQKFLGFNSRQVEKMAKPLKGKYAGIILCVLRLLPIIPLSLVSMAAGFLKFSSTSFGLWTLIGSMGRCFILGYLGWMLRETYEGFAGKINSWEGIISALFLGLIFAFIFYLRKKVKDHLL